MTVLFVYVSELAEIVSYWEGIHSKSARKETGGICGAVLPAYLGIDALTEW